MPDVLFAWIGATDLKASEGADAAGAGPIAQAVETRRFARVVLITDWPVGRTARYVKWLRARSGVEIDLRDCELASPTDFGAIYEVVAGVVSTALREERSATPVFHLSPGTPAMAAVWIILGKTRFPAELIESSPQHGVRTASVPFDISADFIPDLLRRPDAELERLSAGLPPGAPEFADIVYRGPAMARVVALARRVAPRSITVLIEGESGTGKELLARAVHRASPRRGGPFVAVNCGAIPPELAESELFGHKKGAFTGGTADRSGHFEAAGGGTIFLDEIGELPAAAQAKLLRVLQEREVVRVGESRARPVDARVIAATNRSLVREVSEGRFREDLFYRLAIMVLQLPPLRERAGDLGPLVDRLLEQINRESAGEPGFERKSLSAAARNALLGYHWPGNVRELQNVLRRAIVWSDGGTIGVEDVRSAMLPAPGRGGVDGVLGLTLGGDFSIDDVLARVARHYLERALREANGNKSRAAELVGLASYQTFTNWMKRYGVGVGESR